MGTHDHTHGGADNKLDRRLGFSIGLNTLIVCAEIIGGLLSGSLALLSDAMHNLSDVVALSLALVARVVSRRPPSPRHTYGLGRTEVLAALVNSATLLIVSTLIVREAVERLLHPQPVRGGLMLTVALIGLAANLISMLLLKSHGSQDLNMRSAFLHLAQDTLSSVVVVLAALFSHWHWGPYLDPAASILVILLILHGSWTLLRVTLRILLEGTPPDLDQTALRVEIEREFPISELRHIHVWELKPGHRLLTAHVVMEERSLDDITALLNDMRRHLHEHWSIEHSTLQPQIQSNPVDCPFQGKSGEELN